MSPSSLLGLTFDHQHGTHLDDSFSGSSYDSISPMTWAYSSVGDGPYGQGTQIDLSEGDEKCSEPTSLLSSGRWKAVLGTDESGRHGVVIHEDRSPSEYVDRFQGCAWVCNAVELRQLRVHGTTISPI